MISASETVGSPTNALIQRAHRHQALPVLFHEAGQPLRGAPPRRAVQPFQSYVVAQRAAHPVYSERWEAVDTPQLDARVVSADASAYPGNSAATASLAPASATSAMAPSRWVRRALSRLAQPTAPQMPQDEAVAVLAADDLTQPSGAPPAPVQRAQTHTAAQFEVRTDAPSVVHAPPVFSSSPAAAERTAQTEPASTWPEAQPSAAQQIHPVVPHGRVVQAQLASPTAARDQEAPRVFSTAAASGSPLVHGGFMAEARLAQPASAQPLREPSPAPPRVVQAQLAPPTAAKHSEAPAAFPPAAGLMLRSWARQPVEAPVPATSRPAPVASAQQRTQPVSSTPIPAAASPAEHSSADAQASDAGEDRTWERLKAILQAHGGRAQANPPSATRAPEPAAPPVQRMVEDGKPLPTRDQHNPAAPTVETLDASGAAAPPASPEPKAAPAPLPAISGSDKRAQLQPGIAQPVEPGALQSAARSDSPAVPAAPETAQVERMLRSLPPARATESAIQVIAPRTPRPVQRQPAPRAEDDRNAADNLGAPEPETAAAQGVEAPPRAPSQFAIHNSPLAPRPSPLSEPGAGLIQMVDTEIGAMPVDLWALIGATPPLLDGNSPRHGQGAARVAPDSEFGAPVAGSVSAGGEPPAATWMADAALTRGAPLLAAEPRHEMRRPPENERMVGQGAPAVVHGDARPGAALQRQSVDVATAVMRAATEEMGAPGSAADLPESTPGPTPAPTAAMAEPDVHELARQVYAHLRRRLAVEWERLG